MNTTVTPPLAPPAPAPHAPIKLILCAESGAGKTGALASLAAAGYKLRMLDLDNNSGILRNLLSKPSSPYVRANASVLVNLESVLTFAEPRGLVGGKLGITKAVVWSEVSAALADWKGRDGTSLGPITSWTSEHVLVIDTFTRLSQAAMNFHLAMNGRLNQKPILYDFGDAQQLLRYFLEIITSPEVGCNVVLSCHIDKTENKSTSQPEEYPMSIGAALGPQIATYFGSLLKIDKVGSGEKLRRVIRTVPSSALGVKTSIPFDAKSEYPLETGLADYFEAVRGG
jgi:AAA domain